MSCTKEVNKISGDYKNQSKRELDKRLDEVSRKVPEYGNLPRHRNEIGYEYPKKSIDGEQSELKNLEDEIRSTEGKMYKLPILSGLPSDHLSLKHRCDKCEDAGVYDGKMCFCKKAIMVNTAHERSSLGEQIEDQNFDRFDINAFDTEKDSS